MARKTAAEWRTEIKALDATIAELEATGASGVTGFGRSANYYTLGELRRQRVYLQRQLNLAVDPNSFLGSIAIT